MFNQLYNTKSLLVIDDGKYFCFKDDNEPGNSGYCTSIKETSSESVRFLRKEKFPKKLIMWIVVSDRDISEPLFRTSTAVATNTSIYFHKCHGDFNYLFWPDLVSSHYSKDSLNWMNESIMLIRNPTHQMYLKHEQLRTFGDIRLKRFTREVDKL